jgi:glycyl-tRNA synthetase beta chain
MLDRLRGILRERGFSPNEIEAVVAQNPTAWTTSCSPGSRAAFAALPEAAAGRRQQAHHQHPEEERRSRGQVAAGGVNVALLQDVAEKKLPPPSARAAGSRRGLRQGDFTAR